jgi:hypothetical protein
MSNLQFDQYQFAGRRSQPVEAHYSSEGWSSNGIAYEDYKRMSSQSSSVPLRQPCWTPAFAASDEKLRRVLLHKAWMYLHGSGRPASAPDDWKTINAAATKKGMEIFTTSFAKCPAHKRRESAAHIAALKRAGGYLELQAAISYRAWRRGQDSVAIAESLGMSPQSVRMTLHRICEVARKLGYETFPRHRSFGQSHVTIKTVAVLNAVRRCPPAKAARPAHTDERRDCIIALYKAEKNLSQIAQAIGYSKYHVREVLLRAGIYKRRGPDGPDILTLLELAARLKVTKWWVYHQMRPTVRAQGSPLPAVKIGGYLRFHWPDVAAWLLARELKKGSHAGHPL